MEIMTKQDDDLFEEKLFILLVTVEEFVKANKELKERKKKARKWREIDNIKTLYNDKKSTTEEGYYNNLI